MLTILFDVGNDMATSSADVVNSMFTNFGSPIYLIVGIGIVALLIMLILKLMIK